MRSSAPSSLYIFWLIAVSVPSITASLPPGTTGRERGNWTPGNGKQKHRDVTYNILVYTTYVPVDITNAKRTKWREFCTRETEHLNVARKIQNEEGVHILFSYTNTQGAYHT